MTDFQLPHQGDSPRFGGVEYTHFPRGGQALSVILCRGTLLARTSRVCAHRQGLTAEHLHRGSHPFLTAALTATMLPRERWKHDVDPQRPRRDSKFSRQARFLIGADGNYVTLTYWRCGPAWSALGSRGFDGSGEASSRSRVAQRASPHGVVILIAADVAVATARRSGSTGTRRSAAVELSLSRCGVSSRTAPSGPLGAEQPGLGQGSATRAMWFPRWRHRMGNGSSSPTLRPGRGSGAGGSGDCRGPCR